MQQRNKEISNAVKRIFLNLKTFCWPRRPLNVFYFSQVHYKYNIDLTQSARFSLYGQKSFLHEVGCISLIFCVRNRTIVRFLNILSNHRILEIYLINILCYALEPGAQTRPAHSCFWRQIFSTSSNLWASWCIYIYI